MSLIVSPKNFPTFTSDFSCENTEIIEMIEPKECLHHRRKGKLYGRDDEYGFYEFAEFCRDCSEFLRAKWY